jgi:hypothetical protein
MPRLHGTFPLSVLPVLLLPRLPTVMKKFPFCPSHPVLLWFRVMVMLRFLSRATMSFDFPHPPALQMFALNLPRRLAAGADALSDMVDTDLLFLLLQPTPNVGGCGQCHLRFVSSLPYFAAVQLTQESQLSQAFHASLVLHRASIFMEFSCLMCVQVYCTQGPLSTIHGCMLNHWEGRPVGKSFYIDLPACSAYCNADFPEVSRWSSLRLTQLHALLGPRTQRLST